MEPALSDRPQGRESNGRPRPSGRASLDMDSCFQFETQFNPGAAVAKATGFFERHGGKVVTIARFVEGLRQANGIIAGISGMHWAKFLAFNALGAALWVAVWTTVGYFSGSNINTIYDAASRVSTYLAIAVGVLLLGWIAWHVWRIRKRRRARLAR